MATIVKKVTEKNTKKQILEEYENAIKLIKELENEIKKHESIKKSTTTPKIENKEKTQSDENISVDILIDKFNKFSNLLKNDMITEIQFIDELKNDIDSKINSIKNIYSSNPSISLEKLILSYKNLIKEQEEKISKYKKDIVEKMDKLKDDFRVEKNQKIEEFSNKENSFKKMVTRTDKSDAYRKQKAIYALKKERNELIENNKSIIEDLKYEYETENRERYINIEEEIKLQKETIEKAESQKDKFEQTVNLKVTSIVNKEKNSNEKEYKSIVEEYQNKIKLKSTQLDNLEGENELLKSQIDKLLSEIKAIQEKAHILASKTIDAKSSTESFKAMKDVAMEQARGKK